jgi:exopolysaccharide biosynthesis polyprenyl glycosylphosphotransferase
MAVLLALLEGCTILAGLCASMLVARPLLPGLIPAANLLALAAVLTLDAVAALYYADCYEFRVVPSLGRFIARLPRALILATGAFVVTYVFYPDAWMPAKWTGLLMIGVLPLGRAVFYRAVRSSRFITRVLVIGSGALAAKVVEAIEDEAPARDVIVGIVHDGTGTRELLARYPLVGTVQDLDTIIEATGPQRIVVALEDRRRRLPVRPLLDARLRGIVVEEGVEFFERLTGKIAIEALTPSSLIFSSGFHFRPPRAALVVGRVVSLAAAIVGLGLLAPLFGAIALAIRMDSPGPVFFVQERLGLGGRRFRLVKFRTMRAIETPRSEWEGDNRDRITRVGHWLRKFRLDELPQFVNVLRGDMDLVGPRPHPVTNFSLFVTVLRNSPECGEQIPYYSLRCMTRPGITGWAQVRYRYANNLEEEIEKMRYDVYYVKHRSLFLDLRILAETVKTVLAGSGSADIIDVTAPPTPVEPASPWALLPKPALLPPASRQQGSRSADAA